MYPNDQRVITLLENNIEEMNLLMEMSKDIEKPDDFLTDVSGMIVFRACGMSLQFITENFVKIRNLCGADFFKPYSEIPWSSVFGMRNFLSHEYGDVDALGIFNTIKTDIPPLLKTTEKILSDIRQN